MQTEEGKTFTLLNKVIFNHFIVHLDPNTFQNNLDISPQFQLR
jgi:hypothetical protein